MKPINRTDRMAGGTEIAPGVAKIYAGEPGGPRKIRCPKCQCIAAPVPDVTTSKGRGQRIRCPSCGSEFSSSPM